MWYKLHCFQLSYLKEGHFTSPIFSLCSLFSVFSPTTGYPSFLLPFSPLIAYSRRLWVLSPYFPQNYHNAASKTLSSLLYYMPSVSCHYFIFLLIKYQSNHWELSDNLWQTKQSHFFLWSILTFITCLQDFMLLTEILKAVTKSVLGKGRASPGRRLYLW